ncbi:MAG: SDR family oxidoreductase [Deltaproteobacteria bacterium]|nr:SDR family oxidoreductase [Deltaproteobacteria bacterium]
MDKILVTGATGFVGAALVRRLLRQGRDIRITVRSESNLKNIRDLPIELVQADVRSIDDLKRAIDGCSRVYHVAGLYRSWMRDYAMLRHINVQGTRNVLEAAHALGVKKVVHTSSIAALGLPADGSPADENTAFNLQHLKLPYEQSKFEAELVVREYFSKGLPVVIVRPAMVMGPGDLYPTPSGKIVLDMLHGRVPCYFDGGIDIVDVDDVAAGHMLAMEHAEPGETFNLGCQGNFTDMGDLFRLIARLGGVHAPFLKMPVIGTQIYARILTCIADYITHREPLATPANIRILALKRRVDFSKAVRILGLPQTRLCDIVKRTINWYKNEGYA